jgi:hypothetical protein
LLEKHSPLSHVAGPSRAGAVLVDNDASQTRRSVGNLEEVAPLQVIARNHRRRGTVSFAPSASSRLFIEALTDFHGNYDRAIRRVPVHDLAPGGFAGERQDDLLFVWMHTARVSRPYRLTFP